MSTNDYLNEVLEEFDRTPNKQEKAGEGSDIIIGVKGSGDEADKYFADKELDETLFEQSGAYALSADGIVYGWGENNYGHPAKEALDRFAAIGAAVYRTDQQGTIIFRR